MNDYIKNLYVSIDKKLQDYAMNEGVSIIDLHILYHHHVTEISKLFYKPKEHYSKIIVLAYNKTIKDVNKDERKRY